MIGDGRDPAQLRALQLRALARYVADDVYPYSAYYRRRLDGAGLARTASGEQILASLPPTSFAEIGDPAELVLRPDEKTLQRFASPRMLAKVAWAKLRRQADRLNRELIDPVYKPVRWVIADGVPIGYTDEDIDRLAEQGRRWLALAGLGRYDVVLEMLPAARDVGWWELVEGARAAGVSMLHLPGRVTAQHLRVIRPTVVAGTASELERLLQSTPHDARAGVHTLLVVGDALDDVRRAALRALAPDAVPVAAWAPPGVRSLWVECRGGTVAHTSPDVDLVEVDRGEVVWTGIDWKGSALLRLRTGVTGHVDQGPCPTCGRTSPRVGPGAIDDFDARLEAMRYQRARHSR